MRLKHGRQMVLAARVLVVRERRVRPDEHVVAYPETVPELHAAFDRDAIADHDIVLDEHVIADVAVLADGRARQHVGECPDARVPPDAPALAESLRMHEDSSLSRLVVRHANRSILSSFTVCRQPHSPISTMPVTY